MRGAGARRECVYWLARTAAKNPPPKAACILTSTPSLGQYFPKTHQPAVRPLIEAAGKTRTRKPTRWRGLSMEQDRLGLKGAAVTLRLCLVDITLALGAGRFFTAAGSIGPTPADAKFIAHHRRPSCLGYPAYRGGFHAHIREVAGPFFLLALVVAMGRGGTVETRRDHAAAGG